jgi:two-component system, OmpR family, response regulator VicR
MKNLRILVVDDDPSIRHFVQVNLEARGYKVFMASNGEEAVRNAEKEKPDLIILDIIMPGMDGFEVCRKIRKSYTVPIIMLSARESENDKEKCEACGADEYITKPFVLRDLLSLVANQVKIEPIH